MRFLKQQNLNKFRRTDTSVSTSISGNVNLDPALNSHINLNANVGIKNSSPSESLDVVGNVKIGGKLNIESSENTVNDITGALRVSGGVNVKKDVIISGNETLNGDLSIGGNIISSGDISSSGTISATDFDSLSDINYKTNIISIENALDKLLQIDGYKFDWKDTHKTTYGVIAQEIEKVFPELVNVKDEVRTVNYNGIIAVLIKCINELQQKINK